MNFLTPVLYIKWRRLIFITEWLMITLIIIITLAYLLGDRDRAISDHELSVQTGVLFGGVALIGVATVTINLVFRKKFNREYLKVVEGINAGSLKDCGVELYFKKGGVLGADLTRMGIRRLDYLQTEMSGKEECPRVEIEN